MKMLKKGPKIEHFEIETIFPFINYRYYLLLVLVFCFSDNYVKIIYIQFSSWIKQSIKEPNAPTLTTLFFYF